MTNLSTTSPSDPLIRLQAKKGASLPEGRYSAAEGSYGVKGAEVKVYLESIGVSLDISAHARAVWTFGTPHTETLPTNASASETRAC
jgi:hypothetical protein